MYEVYVAFFAARIIVNLCATMADTTSTVAPFVRSGVAFCYEIGIWVARGRQLAALNFRRLQCGGRFILPLPHTPAR